MGKIIHEEDFIINEDKTYWVTQKRPQIVTGLIVNDKVSFGKKKYKQLSAIIHNCYKTQDILEQREIAIKKGYKISNMKNFLYGNVSFLNCAANSLRFKNSMTFFCSQKVDSGIISL